MDKFYWKAALKTFLIMFGILVVIGFFMFTPGHIIGKIMLGIFCLLVVYILYIVVTLIYRGFAEQERLEEQQDKLDNANDTERRIKYD